MGLVCTLFSFRLPPPRESWAKPTRHRQPGSPNSGYKTHRPLVAFAVHCGTLCKANMAAACARALCKVGWTVLESPAARRPVTFSYPAGNVVAFGSRRAFGTGGAALRTKVFPSLRAGSGRLLGCAFLLGGGLGLYQTVKFRVQQHLAEEETKVSVHIPVSLTVSPSQGSRCQYIPGRLLDSPLASASACLLTGRVTWYLRLMSIISLYDSLSGSMHI